MLRNISICCSCWVNSYRSYFGLLMNLLYPFFAANKQPVLYAGRYPVYKSLDEVMKPVDVLNAILNTNVTPDIVCMQKTC